VFSYFAVVLKTWGKRGVRRVLTKLNRRLYGLNFRDQTKDLAYANKLEQLMSSCFIYRYYPTVTNRQTDRLLDLPNVTPSSIAHIQLFTSVLEEELM